MSTVSAADTGNILAQYQNPTSTKKPEDDIQDRFMTLLISQMQNQDPLNPLDNAQVTSQLAQLNTVKGIEQLNQTVGMLMGRVQNSEALAGIGAVGKLALVGGEKITLYEGQAAAGFELPADVDALKVKIYDGIGNVLHEADLGAQHAGIHTFVWDGVTDSGETAVNGNYRFEIEARAGNDTIEATPLSIGRVDGVLPNQDELTFNIGGMSPTRLSEIRQFL